MLAQGQLAAYGSHQQQHVRRRFAAAGADEHGGIGIRSEGHVLSGGRELAILVCIRRDFAELVKLAWLVGIVQIESSAAVTRPGGWARRSGGQPQTAVLLAVKVDQPQVPAGAVIKDAGTAGARQRI